MQLSVVSVRAQLKCHGITCTNPQVLLDWVVPFMVRAVVPLYSLTYHALVLRTPSSTANTAATLPLVPTRKTLQSSAMLHVSLAECC